MNKEYLLIFTLAVVAGPVSAEVPQPVQDDPDAWTRTPTRYLGKSEKQYVDAMRARMAIAGRNSCPFGLPQDPSAEPRTPVLTPRKVTKRVERPFSEIVNAVPVSTVNMQEKCFFVADRKFVRGQQFPIKTRQETIKVRVEKVAATRIGFINLKTGEYAEKRLDLLPEGVLPGNQTIIVPGLTPNSGLGSAPLELDLPGSIPKP